MCGRRSELNRAQAANAKFLGRRVKANNMCDDGVYTYIVRRVLYLTSVKTVDFIRIFADNPHIAQPEALFLVLTFSATTSGSCGNAIGTSP